MPIYPSLICAAESFIFLRVLVELLVFFHNAAKPTSTIHSIL